MQPGMSSSEKDILQAIIVARVPVIAVHCSSPAASLASDWLSADSPAVLPAVRTIPEVQSDAAPGAWQRCLEPASVAPQHCHAHRLDSRRPGDILAIRVQERKGQRHRRRVLLEIPAMAADTIRT
jgi:hypothetical protein